MEAGYGRRHPDDAGPSIGPFVPVHVTLLQLTSTGPFTPEQAGSLLCGVCTTTGTHYYKLYE